MVKTFKKNIELFFGRTFHAKRRTGGLDLKRRTYGNPISSNIKKLL